MVWATLNHSVGRAAIKSFIANFTLQDCRVPKALGCVELCGSAGYGENELLEKWARDAQLR